MGFAAGGRGNVAGTLTGDLETLSTAFWTHTRDQGVHGYACLSGVLRMNDKRNYSGIAREASVRAENVQHFMSSSPWGEKGIIQQVQVEVTAL